MQVVIGISEKEYAQICKRHGRLSSLVRSGKVLPKGHGALKDVSHMVFDKYLATDVRAIRSGDWDVFKDGYNAGIDDVKNVLSEASTVIEADKEVDE